MNIALFAANSVGNEVSKFFGENPGTLRCLVLDPRDPGAFNVQIIENCGAGGEAKIFYHDALDQQQTLSALAALNLDLIILAWWPYIVKKELLDLPRLGCLNFHPSYLPYNRGKNYNFWALVEENPFGVSLHWVDEGIDTGDIAFQRRVETTWEDTGATLYAKAQEEIVRLFRESYPAIKSGNIPRVPQDLQLGSSHFARELDDASKIELDKTYSARALLNILRARTFPPHPAAWFTADGKTYEVRVEIKETGSERRRD